jgi:hypothetical protein
MNEEAPMYAEVLKQPQHMKQPDTETQVASQTQVTETYERLNVNSSQGTS